MSSTFVSLLLFACLCTHQDLHSFPTRRSSDLKRTARLNTIAHILATIPYKRRKRDKVKLPKRSQSGKYDFVALPSLDRKSTRLNSSHLGISYAVFCLKKKKQKKYRSNTYKSYS